MSNIQIFKNFAEFIKSNYVSTLILTILMALLYSIPTGNPLGLLIIIIYLTLCQTFLVFFGKKFLLFENRSDYFLKTVNMFEKNNKPLLKESFFISLGFTFGIILIYIFFMILIALVPEFKELILQLSFNLYINLIFSDAFYKILIFLFVSNYFMFFIYKEMILSNKFFTGFKKSFLIFNPLFYIKNIRFKYLKTIVIWTIISTILDLSNNVWLITSYIYTIYTAMLISSLLYHEQNQKSK